MTREEAITVFKAFMDNPLFSDVHKAAFNIAIHDIKAHHDWDINKLILINKDNYEVIEQEPVLDNIRAEIWDLQYGDEERSMTDAHRVDAYNNAIRQVIEIIDKYKAESEE